MKEGKAKICKLEGGKRYFVFYDFSGEVEV